MANYRNTNDLKKEVLKKCGEVQDGTSNYDTDALIYLNSAYHGLMSGGNEFGIDIADPWPWALSRRPIIITLLPAYTTGTVTMTSGSLGFTFSVAPTTYLGWFLKIEGREEYFVVKGYNAGVYQLDQPYTAASGTFNFQLIKLDYDLVDDTIVVEGTNNILDFSVGASVVSVQINTGVYTPTGFVTAVTIAMAGATGAVTFANTWDSVRRVFTWGSSAGTFSLLLGSGANIQNSMGRLMGLDMVDFTPTSGATKSSYVGTYPLNAINRLTAPMLTYKRADWQGTYNSSPKDEGKIFEVEYNTFTRDFPMTRLQNDIPDKFAVVRAQNNGIVTVRFNAYVSDNTRVEIPYIAAHFDLQDNVNSIPVVPFAFREYLVHAASYYLLADKEDSKSENEAKLAVAKLQALLSHTRKSRSLAGNNYGKLIPRRIVSRRRTY